MRSVALFNADSMYGSFGVLWKRSISRLLSSTTASNHGINQKRTSLYVTATYSRCTTDTDRPLKTYPHAISHMGVQKENAKDGDKTKTEPHVRSAKGIGVRSSSSSSMVVARPPSAFNPGKAGMGGGLAGRRHRPPSAPLAAQSRTRPNSGKSDFFQRKQNSSRSNLFNHVSESMRRLSLQDDMAHIPGSYGTGQVDRKKRVASAAPLGLSRHLRNLRNNGHLLTRRRYSLQEGTDGGVSRLPKAVSMSGKAWTYSKRPFSASSSNNSIDNDENHSSKGPSTVKSLKDIVKLMKRNKDIQIVIMAGAGISTASGIPDFRTPGTGLYDNLQQYNIPYPEAIFDLSFFHVNPRPFMTLARELWPSGKYHPNYVHFFMKLLEEKGNLLRIYSQNIDGLETISGISPQKLVEAHGTFSKATCVRCATTYTGEDLEIVKEIVLDGHILPRCKNEGCGGIVKPDVVFFGEALPKRFFQYFFDFPRADLLIVMGTSLEVEPFASIVSATKVTTPRLLINRDIVGPWISKRSSRKNDVAVEGDLVRSVRLFVELLGWEEDIAKLIQEYWDDYGDGGDIPPGLCPTTPPSTPCSSNTPIASPRNGTNIAKIQGYKEEGEAKGAVMQKPNIPLSEITVIPDYDAKEDYGNSTDKSESLTKGDQKVNDNHLAQFEKEDNSNHPKSNGHVTDKSELSLRSGKEKDNVKILLGPPSRSCCNLSAAFSTTLVSNKQQQFSNQNVVENSSERNNNNTKKDIQNKNKRSVRKNVNETEQLTEKMSVQTGTKKVSNAKLKLTPSPIKSHKLPQRSKNANFIIKKIPRTPENSFKTNLPFSDNKKYIKFSTVNLDLLSCDIVSTSPKTGSKVDLSSDESVDISMANQGTCNSSLTSASSGFWSSMSSCSSSTLGFNATSGKKVTVSKISTSSKLPPSPLGHKTHQKPKNIYLQKATKPSKPKIEKGPTTVVSSSTKCLNLSPVRGIRGTRCIKPRPAKDNSIQHEQMFITSTKWQ